MSPEIFTLIGESLWIQHRFIIGVPYELFAVPYFKGRVPKDDVTNLRIEVSTSGLDGGTVGTGVGARVQKCLSIDSLHAAYRKTREAWFPSISTTGPYLSGTHPVSYGPLLPNRALVP